jgi:hypothetical protein
MSPEMQLLFAIYKQIITDYIKLDPDSDCVSADFFESEAQDFKTAENIIFYDQPIYFGDIELSFDDLVGLFQEKIPVTPRQARRLISQQAIDF